MPKGITTNIQLQQLAKCMRILYFYAYYLTNRGSVSNESSIVNLDNADGPNTHWIAYAKRGDRVVYFDSFGNLRPPKELMKYLDVKIEYNRTPYQHYQT